MHGHSRLQVALISLALATAIVASPVTAASTAGQQRVMIVQKHRFGDPIGTFELHALSAGRLGLDSGSYAYIVAEQPPIVRRGQGIAIYVKTDVFAGRRGTLVVRSRLEFVGAGAGATVGTGLWAVVRGTKAYAGLKGSGRVAVIVVTQGGLTTAQYEGLVLAQGGHA